jgi:glycyl-tRNA synthetase beta chain
MFNVGLEPTGSKDPFALRRAANAVVRILAESGLPLSLSDILASIQTSEEVADRLSIFFDERIEFYLREVRGHAYDVVKAILAAGLDDLRDIVARAEALSALRGGNDFLAVSSAFKRMKNILVQALERGDRPKPGSTETVGPAERDLITAAESFGESMSLYVLKRDYVSAFEAIGRLRPQVDRYFEEVMVLDPDKSVREARLFLLWGVVSNIQKIADLSEIVTAG